MRIKKGDTVKIVSGKDQGKTGQVLQVYPRLEAVLVENINVYKKHKKPRRQGEKGEVINVAKPLNLSNVMPFCKACNKGVRTGYKGEGLKKARVCKSCSKTI